jgi:acyl-CoA hydrolase
MSAVLETPQTINRFTTIHTFTVFPENLNYGGTLFGGKVLAEMDIAAANTARRLLYDVDCDGVVTACLDRVDFIAPAGLGDIIEIKSRVARLGRTSIEIRTLVQKEDTRGKISKICEAKFTFVVMKDGMPFPHGQSFNNENNS